MSEPLTGVLNLDLIGNSAALDFTNTVHNYGADCMRDELTSYEDWVKWSERVGAVDGEAARGLLAEAAARPRKAAQALEQARDMRRLIYDVFSAIHEGGNPKAAQLEILNDAASEAGRLGTLTRIGEQYVRRWSGTDLARPIWPVIIDAIHLLQSDQLDRLRLCAAGNCTWLFVDKTKNRSRRWCEMGTCGNREKSRKHYRKTRDEARQ